MTDKFQSYITVFTRFDTLIVKMSKIKMLTKRRAVSPVIATVILVAVTITVAVAVSYWMSNITGQYTAFEKIEIQSGYSTKIYKPADGTAGEELSWLVTIKLKNTGSAPSTITSCFVNEKPIEEYLYATSTRSITWAYDDGTDTPATMPEDGITIESGTSATLLITIVKFAPGLGTDDMSTGITFTSGTTINVKLHSAGGMDYIRLTQLN
ncbi:unnamed protein product [marine sediment metagenome]|uniref:DUF4352 domain-containing protein n=1 Tax=marine sediment metagenome TaxID=412755 RepID=X1JWU9_9ZZZZ